MERSNLVTRRTALRKVGKAGLAATAAAGLATLVGRPSTASACGNIEYILTPGQCSKACPPGYWCFQEQTPAGPAGHYCCRSNPGCNTSGCYYQCSCSRP
jgi:hypothetical protein